MISFLLALALSGCRAEGEPKFVIDVDNDDVPAEDDCNDNDPEASTLATWYADEDGDGVGGDSGAVHCGDPGAGWSAESGDCDDTDDGVFPGATETCDERDEDCDDLVDEELPTSAWYTDADGDGYGDVSTRWDTCLPAPEGSVDNGEDCNDAAPEVHPGAEETCTDTVDLNCDGSVGYADNDGDGYAACVECDDGDAAINPGATEVCNERDDDCDGSVDEDATGGSTFYADVDGDGFGDLSATTSACSAPDGYVEDASDCDDGQSDVNPAATEVCNERDDDCDGAIDESGDTVFYVDADGDGWGDDAVTVTGCALPEGYVEVGGDCDDTDAAFNPGAAESDCADPTDYNCDGSVGYDDNDGDGFAACEECNDTSADVYPGAPEVCNDADDDCDGAVDDDASGGATWYADADGDTYGDPASTTEACDAPEGYVADATDCADADAGVNPAAPESCDGVDEDCDGLVDEDAYDPTAWYTDADGDGWGDDATATLACEAPADTVSLGGDCDDGDAAFNPGAAEEDCADPTDYNCDGSTGYADGDSDGFAACEDCDDGDAAVHPDATEVCNAVDDDCDGTVDQGASDPATFYADADGDGFGDAASPVEACDAPDGTTADSTDCDDTDSSVSPDAPETCNLVDDDCDGEIDEDAFDATAWYTDADGDGFGDSAEVVYACAAPEGTVAAAGDCDDGDVRFYPGADESDCTDANDYNCDGSVAFADTDRDGWAACAECDDLNAAVNPGAMETCNGVDDDCNGSIDESGALGESTWYADADGDSYGGDSAIVACDRPDGHVATTGDCDDDAAAVNPAATELCNGIDDDCDAATDEAGAGGESAWYADDDGDGVGGDDAVVSCDAPSGHVATTGDCADDDATVYPGATEWCDDVDDDCDGVVDDAAVDAPTWYTDGDSDGFGASTWGEACDQPSGTSALGTDCDDGDAAISPSGIEACNGLDDDCDGATDEAGAVGEEAWYADLDGDGYGDASAETIACDPPADSTDDATDCDDSAFGINPAATEVCDGVDEDCDAVIDDGATCPCVTDTFEDHTYQFCTTPLAWADASAACEATGYSLVTVDGDAENTWLVDGAYPRYTGKWWTGYNDIDSEGVWTWSSGSSASYTNWHDGEPNNSGEEDCMQLGRYLDYTWNDEPCASAFHYICEAGD